MARNTTSLQIVQEWAVQQTWNDCLAMRYRIDSSPVFGTLFAAFTDDIKQLKSEKLPTPGSGAKRHGNLLFRQEGGWARTIASGFPDTSSTRGQKGSLSTETTAKTLRALADGIPRGRRLLLLAEVTGEPDPLEWDSVKTGLYELLPERLGLVLCGAPDGFTLPTDPHYLDLDLAGIDTEPGPEAFVYELAAVRGDRPTNADWLGVLRYAEALAQLVVHPGTTPLTVAIHGPWGKGKSSFMLFVRDCLVGSAAAVALGLAGQPELKFDSNWEPERPRAIGRWRWLRAMRTVRGQVVTVEFNAWRYQDAAQIWAGLASKISSKLEAALPRWRRVLTPLAYAWRTRRADLVVELVLPSAIAVLIIVLAAVAIPDLHDWVDEQLKSDALAQLLGGVLPAAGAAIGSFWLVASRTRRLLAPLSERVLTYIRRPDYREQMGYQHRVLSDLKFVVERLRPKPRIVVFIDDLDRCPDDKIMELLQAINLILGESEFYVFLGIDTAMIHRAIESHYSGPQLPRRFAETYLQKIIQLPFFLPETRSEERCGFIAELFSAQARQGDLETGDQKTRDLGGSGPPPLAWNHDVIRPAPVSTMDPVEDTATELEAFRDLKEYLEDNPRELKRLVNLHRFVKIVLQREGRPASRTIQRKLVKWMVFCARWPELVDDALQYASDHPESLDCLAPVLTRLKPKAKAFAALVGTNDQLTADDLALDGPLAQAATISRLVVWQGDSSPPVAT